jgi:hypothetical protein
MNTSPNQSSTDFALEHDAFGRLVLLRGGERFIDVEPVRSFPLSEPLRYISIVDSSGKELLHIDDLTQLADDLRHKLLRELSLQEFMPQITRITKITTDGDPAGWSVETDRGPTDFIVNSEDDLRRLGEFRVLISDATGVRYLIPDLRLLDLPSRKKLARYL